METKNSIPVKKHIFVIKRNLTSYEIKFARKFFLTSTPHSPKRHIPCWRASQVGLGLAWRKENFPIRFDRTLLSQKLVDLRAVFQHSDKKVIERGRHEAKNLAYTMHAISPENCDTPLLIKKQRCTRYLQQKAISFEADKCGIDTKENQTFCIRMWIFLSVISKLQMNQKATTWTLFYKWKSTSLTRHRSRTASGKSFSSKYSPGT